MVNLSEFFMQKSPGMDRSNPIERSQRSLPAAQVIIATAATAVNAESHSKLLIMIPTTYKTKMRKISMWVSLLLTLLFLNMIRHQSSNGAHILALFRKSKSRVMLPVFLYHRFCAVFS